MSRSGVARAPCVQEIFCEINVDPLEPVRYGIYPSSLIDYPCIRSTVNQIDKSEELVPKLCAIGYGIVVKFLKCLKHI